MREFNWESLEKTIQIDANTNKRNYRVFEFADGECIATEKSIDFFKPETKPVLIADNLEKEVAYELEHSLCRFKGLRGSLGTIS